MQRKRGITLEQKLRYLKEVDSIHALGKKVKPPAGKSWSEVADARFRQVMGLPLKVDLHDPIRVEDGGMHHQHSPRSARLIERTLKSGLVHPDVLLHYHTGEVKPHSKGSLTFLPRRAPAIRGDVHPRREMPRHEDVRVQHVVQHPGDLHYPHGHLQGHGFVPKQHTFNTHIEVGAASGGMQGGPLPTKSGPPGGNYH